MKLRSSVHSGWEAMMVKWWYMNPPPPPPPHQAIAESIREIEDERILKGLEKAARNKKHR